MRELHLSNLFVPSMNDDSSLTVRGSTKTKSPVTYFSNPNLSILSFLCSSSVWGSESIISTKLLEKSSKSKADLSRKNVINFFPFSFPFLSVNSSSKRDLDRFTSPELSFFECFLFHSKSAEDSLLFLVIIIMIILSPLSSFMYPNSEFKYIHQNKDKN